MATKTLSNKGTGSSTSKVTTTVSNVTSEKTTTLVSTSANVYFNVGDTATFSYNGKLLPVVVTGVHAVPNTTVDGDSAFYTVIGDIRNRVYPAGVARGPFVNVPANKLTSGTT